MRLVLIFTGCVGISAGWIAGCCGPGDPIPTGSFVPGEVPDLVRDRFSDAVFQLDADTLEVRYSVGAAQVLVIYDVIDKTTTSEEIWPLAEHYP